MSRTTRAIPHSVRWCLAPTECSFAIRYRKRLGRDGSVHSAVYSPMKRAPGFIDRWREDGVEGINLKRSAKRELRRMHRRDGRKKISVALLVMEGE